MVRQEPPEYLDREQPPVSPGRIPAANCLGYLRPKCVHQKSVWTRCFDSKDLIDRQRKAVDLYDQRDSKGLMLFNSFKEGFPKDHDMSLARNILNQLPEFAELVLLSN
jgi:hypothetical protein